MGDSPGSDLHPRQAGPIVNGLSFDLEDWLHTQNYEWAIPRSAWQHCEFRAIQNTTRILKILGRHSVRATFFVLGWIAERAPELVSMILERGHEVASHGFSHRKVGDLGVQGFRTELLRSLESLAKAGASQVRGFRAPSFSITKAEDWAFDVLVEYGFSYDSSVVPTGLHPGYGIRDAPLSPFKVRGDLWEVPLTVTRVLGCGVPTGGGAYFRLFPYRLTRWMLGRANEKSRPVVVYLHPWEFDPAQPRAPVPAWRHLRQTLNVEHTATRLERLLGDFAFGPILELPEISSAAPAPGSAPPP